MTKTSTVASKAFVAIVAAAMVFSLVAPAAKAATAEELQAQITALMAQIAALSGGTTTTTTTTTSVGAYTFTRSLTLGSTGADVTALQTYLISKGHAIAAGATGYFGAQTAAAVAAWQTANGIAPAAGYFGPVSQAKYMAMMASTPTTPTTPGTTPTTPGTTTTLKGEADLTDFTADDADDDSLNEGANDAAVAVFTAQFENGDASISRLDVKINPSVSGANPWDAIDTLQLWVGGKMVAEADASSKSDYVGSETNGIIRFSGLNIVAMEDEDLEITVGVNLQSGLDTEELTSNWVVNVDSMRYFDADDVATTVDIGLDYPSETATFTVVEAGTNDSADIKKNSDTPDVGTLLVDENTTKKAYDVFMFNIDVDSESSDLEVGDAHISLTVGNPTGGISTTTVDKVISKVSLTIDGKKIKGTTAATTSTNIAGGASQTLTYDFDFDGYSLSADDVYEAVVEVEFKGQNGYYSNNVTIDASVNGSTWDVDGDDSNDVLSGSLSSKTQTIATVVPVISAIKSYMTQAANQSNSGSITFEFKIEATDGDIVLTKAALNAAATLTTSASTSLGKPTPSLTKVSGDATESPSGTFTISEGDTATFRLAYTFTTASSANNGNYSINLLTVAGVEIDETSTDLPLAN